MKLFIAILTLTLCTSLYANVTAEVEISPAGSFAVKSGAIKGQVTQTRDGFSAKKLSVRVNDLKTGMDLRDKHLKEKLGASINPSVILYNVVAKNGNGVGELKVKDIKKKISFSYKKEGSDIIAKFKVNLADYKIDGISYMGVGVKDIVEVTARL